MTMRENSEIYSRSIKHISELFTPFEGSTPCSFIILIEGAPGIGKTILSKEIALQWAERRILPKFKLLFLLFMRDPQVKNIQSILSLVNYFCEGSALPIKVTDWLVETHGKHCAIVLDGYDEVSEGNKSDFINDIVNRKKLTKCGVVITSRPTGSSNLHHIIDCRAEVLGFTKEDRRDFVQKGLNDQNDKIKDLEFFLDSNPFLDSLCNIPLNMSILLCLAEDGIDKLPKTQTKLYEKFAVMAIVHFLKKDKSITTATIGSLDNIPPPYDQVVKQLSQLAFLALQKDQLVFTEIEVKATWPDFNPAKWYGLGLLKSAQYFKPQDGHDHESFHFIHFAIQEYMAAYYITSLPDKVQLKLLNDTFWNVRYYNTWIMYVGITGGSTFAFRHFLSGNYFGMSTWLFKSSGISSKILSNKLKCLHLYHCLVEVDHVMVCYIESIFQDGIIDLSHKSLSLSDVRTLAVVILRSPTKQWEKLNLSHCNIDDNGCDVFCKLFNSQGALVRVKSVDISGNHFHWESLSKLCKILGSWKTEELFLSFDSLYDAATMNMINAYASEIRNAILSNVITNMYKNFLLFTYIPEKEKLIAVYADRYWMGYHIFFAPRNCIIAVVKNFVKRRFLAITYTSFSLYISNHSASSKLSALTTIPNIRFCGSNLHSKGAYLLDITSTVQCQNVPLRQQVVDYLAGVMCHNTLSNTSYLNALPATITRKVNKYATKIFSSWWIFY